MTDQGRSNFGGGRGGMNSLKEAIQRRERSQYKRVQANKLEYMDGMQESLNKEIQASVFPHWRNHNSLKGKKTFILLYDNGYKCVCNFVNRLDFNELSDDGNQSFA